jgi:hypothetical protein
MNENMVDFYAVIEAIFVVVINFFRYFLWGERIGNCRLVRSLDGSERYWRSGIRCEFSTLGDAGLLSAIAICAAAIGFVVRWAMAGLRDRIQNSLIEMCSTVVRSSRRASSSAFKMADYPHFSLRSFALR